MSKRAFFTFPEQAHQTWRMLCDRQWDLAHQHACKMWVDGVEIIGLSHDHIPDFEAMSNLFQERVGWELVSTDVQFSDGQDWFEHLYDRKFLITEYIRDVEDLDYTPLPDIWHDAFGHLPFLAHQRYADYLQRFAGYALQFSKEERKSLGSMWWYMIEFGLMREGDGLKALGAGLMSSHAEMNSAFSDVPQKLPYSLEAFEAISPSPHEMHKTFFIVDDFGQVERAVDDWVAKYGNQKHPVQHPHD